MNTKQMKIKNYGKFYGNQEHMLVVKRHHWYLKMVQHQENVIQKKTHLLLPFSIRIAKAAAAYRPPHLRQTTRQVPKLHEDVPVKSAAQQAPRVPKPGGVEELFTGDLEKDKKIKQIHKVCFFLDNNR
jgi:hypothetical protein